MSSIDPIFWLIAAIGFVMIEAMTFGMTSIWFAVGAAAPCLPAFFPTRSGYRLLYLW